MKFLLLSGSFHSKSRSLAVLNLVETCLAGHVCEVPRIDALPFYCEDRNRNKPAVIVDFLSSVENSDGLIICTPEYNHSLPAVLKNAIDWASRPAFTSPLKDKPVSIITQAVSAVGGARAQAHLKLVLDSTLSDIQKSHEMMITGIDKRVDENMQISDETVRRRIERHLADFVTFVNSKKTS